MSVRHAAWHTCASHVITERQAEQVRAVFESPHPPLLPGFPPSVLISGVAKRRDPPPHTCSLDDGWNHMISLLGFGSRSESGVWGRRSTYAGRTGLPRGVAFFPLGPMFSAGREIAPWGSSLEVVHVHTYTIDAMAVLRRDSFGSLHVHTQSHSALLHTELRPWGGYLGRRYRRHGAFFTRLRRPAGLFRQRRHGCEGQCLVRILHAWLGGWRGAGLRISRAPPI